jgi:BASS family bile acid:Na+ symporter
MTAQALILFALKSSIVLSVFALGLQTRPGDVLSLLQRPSLLARSLLAMNVLMPLFAILVVGLFQLRPAIEIALVALAVSPVPPLLSKKQIQASREPSYTIGLLVLAAVVAIVFIPSAIELLGQFVDASVAMKPWPIARLALQTILVPLGAGLVAARLAPSFAPRMVRPIELVGGVALALSVVPILIKVWAPMVALIGDGSVVAIVAFVVAGLAIGHWLGGPAPHDRAVLALATARRHPGIAIAIGTTNFPDQKALIPVILLYTVIGLILTGAYLRWRKSVGSDAPPTGR